MATGLRLEMRRLASVPEALPTLVSWFLEEWEPHYGASGPGDAEADLRASMNRDRLPICLVAIDEAAGLVGTISLKAESFSHTELTPWVAAMRVAPEHRRQGIGGALVGFAEEEARRLGFERVYTATDNAAGIVERRGWSAFDTAESSRGTITIYTLAL